MGFDWETQVFFDSAGREGTYNFRFDNYNKPHEKSYTFSAPTVALALKWVRDVKEWCPYVCKANNNEIKGWLYRFDAQATAIGTYETYEIAESKLLDMMLNLISED